MALFPNPDQTLFKDWPKETQRAFRKYYWGGGKYYCYAGEAYGWVSIKGTSIKPKPYVAYTDDPDAKTPAEYDHAYHSARITPEFRGKPPVEDATAAQPTGVANPDRVPLCEMSEADRLAIAQAWARMEPLWAYVADNWCNIMCDGKLSRVGIYTTMDPTPQLPEVQYPWEWFPDAQYMAHEKSGRFWAFEFEPKEGPEGYKVVKGRWWSLGDITINTHGLHWTKTLVRRPTLTSG